MINLKEEYDVWYTICTQTGTCNKRVLSYPTFSGIALHVFQVHDDGQNYKKRMKSRHEGSYHKKDSVQQGYEKGLEKESMQLAHQDYSSAQDHGYSSVKVLPTG